MRLAAAFPGGQLWFCPPLLLNCATLLPLASLASIPSSSGSRCHGLPSLAAGAAACNWSSSAEQHEPYEAAGEAGGAGAQASPAAAKVSAAAAPAWVGQAGTFLLVHCSGSSGIAKCRLAKLCLLLLSVIRRAVGAPPTSAWTPFGCRRVLPSKRTQTASSQPAFWHWALCKTTSRLCTPPQPRRMRCLQS